MNTVVNYQNQELYSQFTSLKKSVDKQRKSLLKKRITKHPHATDAEYILGAFIEMYEPHLKEIVQTLYKKGYAIDASSGFAGKNGEFQAMTGDFSVDYVIKNKLEKIGVKFREYNGSRSLIFWPQKATLANIIDKWMKIIQSLPDKDIVTTPSRSYDAVNFRRKYIPEDTVYRKQRLFEKLKFKTQKKVSIETRKRQKGNSHPNPIELILGLFIQEIEPQVRHAIVIMNEKGYSTDKSGFMDDPIFQMIEGDFQLDDETKTALENIGVQVNTNPSGYTRLQFVPKIADIGHIKRQWNKIASLLPDKNQTASVSMTRQARDFRIAYQ